MELREGDLLLGRWVVGAALPAQGELSRWRVTDGPEGAPAEVVVASRRARIRDSDGAQARRAGQAPPHPSLLPVLDQGDHNGCPVRIRPLTAGGWPPDQRLDAAQLQQALSSLAPALARTAAALSGELDAQDLVILPDGALRLSPSGLVRERSLARLPLHLPPEGPGASSPEASALYGLGVLLFAAATGSPPVSARALGDLADLQRRPLSAAALAPHLPPDLTRRLDDLVSADPQRRRAALDGLPPATGSLRLRPPLPAPGTVASAPALPRGPAPPTLARPDPPLGDWLVLLDAEASLGARRRLAALLEVPTARLMGEGAQVVAVGRNAEEAQAALSRLEAAHAPLRRVAAPQSRLPAGAALGGGLLLGLFSLILPPPLSLLGLGLALVLAVAGAGLLARAGGAIGDPARLRRAWAALKAPVPAPTDPIATSALGLRQARKAVLERDLPVAVRQDLLASLDELEAELEGLEGAPAARADLDLLDGAAAAIRDAASAHTPAPDLDRTAALARGRAAAAAKALGREG